MTTPLLKVERLRKSFGNHEVLSGIDMEVHRGDVTCIVGPSGSGKSTLLRCLNHLESILCIDPAILPRPSTSVSSRVFLQCFPNSSVFYV